LANSLWTVFVPILWVFAFLAASIWYRRSKGEPIFPRLLADADFGEKGCSGRSLKNFLSRIGGANRCLLVMVRQEQLIVTPQFPFNLMFLPEIYGLDVSAPIRTIAAIKPQSSLFSKSLRIEFARGGPAPIELVLRDEMAFERAIGPQLTLQRNRTLKSGGGPRTSRTFWFVRAFLALWGTFALIAAFSGFQDDQKYRENGVATMATYVNPDPSLDGQTKTGILQYEVDGQDYRLTSIYGVGLYEVGDREKIYYLPSDPQDARQDGYAGFNRLWLLFGAIALSISIFGGMIARHIW
jgi:hypothetical protein